jgi:hypothetical protein
MKETEKTLQFLLIEAQEFKSKEKRLTRSDIRKASNLIANNGHLADILIIDPYQHLELSKHNEITNRGLRQIKKETLHFCGTIDNVIQVYRTLTMSKNIALLFEKQECYINRTPLQLSFDNRYSPEKLIVEEKRIAWFDDKTGAVKIQFLGD